VTDRLASRRRLLRAAPLVAAAVLIPLAAIHLQAATAPLAPGAPAEIQAVIEAQLAAFRRDDGAAAFALASPTIRGIFRTPERFMEMVRGGYQPVYRPRRYRFLELGMERGQPVQRVLFVGPDGMAVIALYLMERQPDGGWRIDGVFLRSPHSVSA
jgi:hypothetical protein